MSFLKCDWVKLGLFAAGTLFGTAGIKVLSSKDAKNAYTHATAAVLRAKDTVMDTTTRIQENCADREALSTGIRDILASQTASTQRILDQMCQDKIDAKNEQISALQTQVTMQNLAASQNAQTAQLIADNNAQTAQLIQRIAPYPVPAYAVANPYGYGYGTGCGCGAVGFNGTL